MSALARGIELPAWELPVTATLIVSGAIATRDFQDVHHDRDLAQSHGSQDIFANILTTNGLVERYVVDWARSQGLTVDVGSIAIRLGAPAHPGDTLHFSGVIEEVDGDQVTVAVRGAVAMGDHVTGTVVISVPEASRRMVPEASRRASS